MQILEDLADELAREVMLIVEVTEDLELEKQVSDILGTSSQTLQEAFLTAMRVRKAEKRARALLKEKRDAMEVMQARRSA